MTKADSEEEAPPRFLLCAGSEPLQVDAVAVVLEAFQPAGLIVGGDWDRGVLDVAREYGVAVLVEDAVDPDADGVHLTDPSRVAEIRSELDRSPQDRLILGADVGLSRHDAMVAGEEGADYVAFGKRSQSADDAVIELVEWWCSLTVIPCLAYAEDAETVGKLARLGTDFIGVSKAIFEHPEGPASAASEMTAALEKT